MRRIVLLLAAAATLGAATAPAHEGHPPGKTSARPAAKAAAIPAATVEAVTLEGEIIDPQCWYTHNGEGPGHARCAVSCARGGQNLAFLDRRSGEVYTILAAAHGQNPNDGLYDHVGVPVSVKGTSYRRGANRGLIVESVQKVKPRG